MGTVPATNYVEGAVESLRALALSIRVDFLMIPTDATILHTFSCHDLEPSAFLWARGLRFLGVFPSPSPSSPNHVVFRFHDPDGLCATELLAYQQGAEIPAQQFALALEQLKDQIFRAMCANTIKNTKTKHERN